MSIVGIVRREAIEVEAATARVQRTDRWLAQVSRRSAKHRSKADRRVVCLWRPDALHEGAGEHVLHGWVRVPRRRLQVRCDTRAVQLEIVVVCVGCKSVSCAVCRPVQVLLDGLLVLERIQEGLIIDRGSGRRRVRLVETATVGCIGTACSATEGLLSTRCLLLEHIGRRVGLRESILVQKALLPHHHLGSGLISVGDLILIE